MLGEATRLIAMVSVGREHLIVLTVSKGRWPVIRLKWLRKNTGNPGKARRLVMCNPNSAMFSDQKTSERKACESSKCGY